MPRTEVLAALVLAIAMSAVAPTAVGAVYKCAGAGGVPLYTDLPCKGGAIVDIRPGTADPVAIARLEREQGRFATLALAEARQADLAAQDAYERDRESSSVADLRSYQDGLGVESGNGLVYVPIFVSTRPSFHRGHGHRHRPKRFVPGRGGATSRPMPVSRGMVAGGSREPASASHVTAIAWR